MRSEPFRIFFSYARFDEEPPQAVPRGWIAALREAIESAGDTLGDQPLRVFVDRRDIRDSDDWRDRILEQLRDSAVLLVGASPSYFASETCRWEWQNFRRRRRLRGLGGEGATIAAVNFAVVAPPPQSDPDEWYESTRSANVIDLVPWFADGAAALTQEPAAAAAVQRLIEALRQRQARAWRVKAASLGNLPPPTEYFIGRDALQRQIHAALSAGDIGVITALHGLGGMGKTELALHYAHDYAYRYSGGMWMLDARGATSLRALIGQLADDPAFPQRPTEADKLDDDARFHFVVRVLEQTRRRVGIDEDANTVLLLLDDVDDEALLGHVQRRSLGKFEGVCLLATARARPLLATRRSRLSVIAVDALRSEEALDLLREWQLRHRFRDEDDRLAAAELVRDLEGYTLAIEQAAIHLGAHPALSIREFLARLRESGLPQLDETASDRRVAGEISHHEKRLALVLQQTIPRQGTLARDLLEEAARYASEAIPREWVASRVLQARLAAGSPVSTKDLTAAWKTLARWRLLLPGGQPGLLRLHRLVQAHLRIAETPDLHASFAEVLLRHVSETVQDGDNKIYEWKLHALQAGILQSLRERRPLAVVSSELFLPLLLELRGPAAAMELAEAAVHEAERLQHQATGTATTLQFKRCLDQLGRLRFQQGRTVLAGELYERAHALAEQEFSERPDAAARRELAVSWLHRGELAERLASSAVALSAYTIALQHCETLHAAQPDCADTRSDLLVVLYRNAEILSAIAGNDAVRELMARACDLGQALLDEAPSDPRRQRDMASLLNHLGELQAGLGQPREALVLLRQAQAMRKRLAARHPAHPRNRRDLLLSNNLLGDTFSQLGQRAKAREHYRRSVAIARRLMTVQPDAAERQADLSTALDKLGNACFALQRYAEAAAAYEEALELDRESHARDPHSLPVRRHLAVSLDKVGRVQAARGEWRAAAETHCASLELREALSIEDPDARRSKRDISLSLENVAQALQQLGDEDGAWQAYRDGRALVHELAQAHPTDADLRRDAWIVDFTLYRFACETGDGDAARSYLQQACEGLAGMQRDGFHVSREDLRLWQLLRKELEVL